MNRKQRKAKRRTVERCLFLHLKKFFECLCIPKNKTPGEYVLMDESVESNGLWTDHIIRFYLNPSPSKHECKLMSMIGCVEPTAEALDIARKIIESLSIELSKHLSKDTSLDQAADMLRVYGKKIYDSYYRKAIGRVRSRKFPKFSKYFEGDIIITDPCYVMKQSTSWEDRDWSKCRHGSDMGVLGLGNSLVSDTVYGDWSCTVFEGKTPKPGSNRRPKKLGEFCADAGLVAVFKLKDVLQYNPEFNYHIEKPWTTALIKNFKGNIRIVYNKRLDMVQVLGFGSKPFFTAQTGF